MKVLISPAKSLNEEPIKVLAPTLPIFKNEPKKIISSLKKLKIADLEQLMHVSNAIATLNFQRYKSWKSSELENHALLQASTAFSGEVYRGLDFTSLNSNELETANNRVRILSGLYGILKPSDLISPYRLEMGTRFSPIEGQKSLYEFWGDKVTKSFKKELKKGEVVVNLASSEYAKVLDFKQVKGHPIVTPVFKEFKNGQYSIVMMYAKHARGAMTRYLVQNELESIEDLKMYNNDGYQFDDKLSTEKEWVFVR